LCRIFCSAKPSEVRTVLTIKLPFSIKNSTRGHKVLIIDTKRIKDFVKISASTIKRLTDYFEVETFNERRKIRKKIDRIKLAKEYRLLLEKGVYKNQAELARGIGVSRVWITKVINTLK